MGIVNVTPDSFYERVASVEAAVAKARAMAGDGAAVVDVGGQSYAHWNARVSAEEERARVVPAVRAVVAAGIDVRAVDRHVHGRRRRRRAGGRRARSSTTAAGWPTRTWRSWSQRTTRRSSSCTSKGGSTCASRGRTCTPTCWRRSSRRSTQRTERALAAGVARDAIAIDPGLEFGKEPATDLEILDRFGELRALGYPILFASSRKSFIGRIFDRPANRAAGAVAGDRRDRDRRRCTAAAGPRRRRDGAVGANDGRHLAERRRAIAFADRMPGTPGGAAAPASNS